MLCQKLTLDLCQCQTTKQHVPLYINLIYTYLYLHNVEFCQIGLKFSWWNCTIQYVKIWIKGCHALRDILCLKIQYDLHQMLKKIKNTEH